MHYHTVNETPPVTGGVLVPRSSSYFTKFNQQYRLLRRAIFGKILIVLHGALAQLARAPALQAGGPGFESLMLHQVVLRSVKYLVARSGFMKEEEFSLTA